MHGEKEIYKNFKYTNVYPLWTVRLFQEIQTFTPLVQQ